VLDNGIKGEEQVRDEQYEEEQYNEETEEMVKEVKGNHS
jgi:hypothetical protein